MYKDVEINGSKYRINKTEFKAAEGSFLLHQIVSNRWMEKEAAFQLVQRKLLRECQIYNELGLIMPVQLDNGKDEPQIVPQQLKDDPGALYALTLQSFEFNLGPTLAALTLRSNTEPSQAALTLTRSDTQP